MARRNTPAGAKIHRPVPATPALSPGTPKNPREILVIKPSSLGDVVHTLPAVARLKRHWPQSRIRWLINPEWAPLLDGNPHVDEILVFPRRQFRGVGGALRIVPWARAFQERVHPDLVLDFQGLLRSALLAKLCRGATRVGLSDAREGARYFYDQIATVDTAAHAVDRYLRLIASLGVNIDPPLEWPLPPGTPPPLFAVKSPFVLLHPFARGKDKSLEDTAVAELCRSLAPIPVVSAGRRAISSNDSITLSNVTNMINQTTLAELIWLIRNAAFVVSVDSGPMHIAAAITPQLLSIHTWSDPTRVGPYRPDAWVWQHGALCRASEVGRPQLALQIASMSALAVWLLDQVRQRE